MNEQHTIVKVCMLAGKIMLQSGAETYRVEDTMNRIASTYGLPNAQSYATPTGINFSIDMSEVTNFMRISNRSTDLHKIAEVNNISRMFAAGEIELKNALSMLESVDGDTSTFSVWLQVMAAAFVSGCFTIMFGGIWADFIPSFIVGGIAFAGMLWFERLVEIRFIAEFFASFIIGVLTLAIMDSGIGVDMDKIIIGAVMPLVPGLHITNAVRDLMAGHLVAGLSKGVEAVLTAFAIGAGIAVVFGLF
ncbi:threonine/serine exporter family protein [Virgibacillus ndiopensis]|uniref:threonine/serine exporter family protein n=1 Tax=Virgibacillus ndiopensis TaxID=2004408 RepID=UPI001FE84FCD|nr:threonine/serine exporter family protein [Virgibacillus ndiopensis]